MNKHSLQRPSPRELQGVCLGVRGKNWRLRDSCVFWASGSLGWCQERKASHSKQNCLCPRLYIEHEDEAEDADNLYSAKNPRGLTTHPLIPREEHITSSHLHGMRLLKPANLLDVVHEVTPIHVLHHKVQAVLGEEGKRQHQHPVISGVPYGQQGIVGFMVKSTRALWQAPICQACCFPKGSICTTGSMQVSIGGARTFLS